jgi:photosystem II stability/assembly factor-like uncharacterized protein
MNPSPPEPQTPPPTQNNVNGTQNNVSGDQYNAAHDQFVGNRDVSVVENNQGTINQKPVYVNQGGGGAAVRRAGCISVNVAITIVSALAVLVVAGVVALNFLAANPDLTGISTGGGVARVPGMAAPINPGAAEGWAVGKHGAIFYYNGSTWQHYDGPTSANLNALYYDGTNGWIVGDGGTILHIGQNDAVSHVPSPTHNNLRSVAGVDRAVATDDQGNVYIFDGSTWQISAQASLGAAGSAIVVPSTNGPVVIHQNGVVQTTSNRPGSPLDGNGTINTLGRSKITSPIVAATVSPPGSTMDNSLWAVGAHGAIYGLKKNGTWDNEPSPTSANLNSISFGKNGQGWIVGDGGIILGWNGKSWQPASSPTGDTLNSVYVGESDETWAVGNSGVILHFVGGVWSKVR